MKRLLAAGATSQIATIIVLSLLTAHALSALLWLSVDPWRGSTPPDVPPEYIRSASQIGLVIRLLNELPAQDRSMILAAAAEGGLHVIEGTGSPPIGQMPNRPFGRFPAPGGRPAMAPGERPAEPTGSVSYPCPADGSNDRFCVLVSRTMPKDGWVLFQMRPNPFWRRHPFPWFSPAGVASFVAFPMLIGAMSLWAARRVTGPLVSLATATEKLSILQDPDPVIEEGAREVRQVAHAFNAVLERLRRFVTDRTTLLASISHDLRTPLTRLKLRAEAVDDPETQRKMLNDIRTMEAMITATLAFIRDEAAHERMERVDVAVLLQMICHEFNDTGTNVEYDGPLHAAGSCRPAALQRAVINLIENAANFEAKVTVRLAAQPEGFVVLVEDDGPGIPDSQKQAVLAPFFRGGSLPGKQKDQVGLGLSIVESIVHSHNGRMELLDRMPHGLCVRLFIPTPLSSVAMTG